MIFRRAGDTQAQSSNYCYSMIVIELGYDSDVTKWFITSQVFVIFKRVEVHLVLLNILYNVYAKLKRSFLLVNHRNITSKIDNNTEERIITKSLAESYTFA